MRRSNSSYSTFSDGKHNDNDNDNYNDNDNDNVNDDDGDNYNERQQQELLIQEQEQETSLASTPAFASIPPPDPTPGEIAFVKFVFTMLGIGFLLPWNAFISAETYFMSRFTKSTCGGGRGGGGVSGHELSHTHNHDNTSTSTGTIIGNTFSRRFLFNSSKSNNSQGDNGDDNDDSDGGSSNFMSWLGLLYNLSGVLALLFLLLQQRAKEIQQQKEQEEREQEQDQHNSDNGTDSHRNGDHDEEQGGREEENHFQRHPPSKLESSSTTTTTDITTRSNSYIDTNTDTSTNGRTRTSNSKQKQTVITSFTINLLIMILTSSLVLIPSFNNSYTTIHLFQIITYVTIISYGTVGAFLSTAVLSYANTFFKYYTDVSVQCFISGQAVGGVVISILNLVLGYVVNGGGREAGYWDDNCHVDVDVDVDEFYSNELGKQGHRELALSSSSSSPMFLETTSTFATAITTTCHKYNIDWGAFSYFTVCCIFLFLCIVLFIMLDVHPVLNFYRYYCCGVGASSSANSNSTPAVQQENQVASSLPAIDTTGGTGGEIEMEGHIHHDGRESINNRGMTITAASNNTVLTSLWTGNGEGKDDAIVGQKRLKNKKKNKKRKKNERGKRRNKYSHKNDDNNDNQNHNITVLQENDSQGQTEQEQTEHEELNPLIEPLLQASERHQVQNDSHNNSNNITFYVWKSIQLPIISIFLTFCVTLTLFPSWTGKLQSALQCQSGSSRFRNDLFIPLMIVLFNVFDLFGRMSSGFVMTHILQSKKFRNHDDNNNDSENRQAQDRQQSSLLQLISKKITFLSMLRIIFLPAFLLCKTDNPSHSDGFSSKESPNSGGSDVYTISLMVLFAFSNGLASTMGFIHAAALIPTSKSLPNSDGGTSSETDNSSNVYDDDTIQKIASTLLNFAVGTGLLLGSLFSFVYNYIGAGF